MKRNLFNCAKINLGKTLGCTLGCILFITVLCPAFSSDKNTKSSSGSIEATSRINWVTRTFVSNISLDTKKEKLQMPSGKKKASASIAIKMPQLIQSPLLSLYTDSAKRLSNYVIDDDLSLDQVYNFIMSGYKTPDVFSQDISSLNTSNTLKIDEIGKYLIYHKVAYNQEEPIDTTPSRAYSGIIIDARGSYPVQGEYVKCPVSACFFPKIWDENMNVIFEKSMENPEVIREKGFVAYHYTDNLEDYEDRIGSDPLYIKAIKVFGRNRTDPIIKRSDALKILTIPENLQLLKDGKIVILLDKENLIFDVATPEKNEEYYVKYDQIKNYFYNNRVMDIDVTDTIEGILFSVNLKFYPDSPDLLPGETERLLHIASQLKELLLEDGYTILIEGHTADVGKPIGQLNLSIERTRTVMNLFIATGIDESLFSYKGYGGTMPVATNTTEEGRAQNRRVDITARPRATYIQRDW